MSKITFGIIGMGRFGKLWSKHLSPFGTVLTYDKKQNNPLQLQKIIKSDLLFLLVPISKIQECCEQIAPYLNQNTIVIDACSVKIFPSKIMLKYLPKKQPIIATHPLFGPDSVTRLGLAGHKITICPLRVNKKQLKIFLALLKQLHLKIIITTPKDHDQQLAKSQALVHFLGRGLTDLNLTPQKIATPDYETLLRMNNMVQNDTWELFYDMQKYNPFSKKIRTQFMNGLKKIENKIK